MAGDLPAEGKREYFSLSGLDGPNQVELAWEIRLCPHRRTLVVGLGKRLDPQRNQGRSPAYQQIMTIRPIVRYPDPRLARLAEPVTVFDAALRELAEGFAGDPARRTGYRHHRAAYRYLPAGGGARPRPDRRGADLCQSRNHLRIARNDRAPGRQCLDAYGVHDDIQRHARVRISYHDIDGRSQTEQMERPARDLPQHEIDQLNGVFSIQRLSRLKRERLIKRFEKASRS